MIQSQSLSLRGAKVGLLGAGNRAEELSFALRRLGASVVQRSEDPESVKFMLARALEDLDLLLLSTPAEVESFFELAADLGFACILQEIFSRSIVAALPAAAASLERKGIHVSICPLREEIDSLIDAIVLTYEFWKDPAKLSIDWRSRTLMRRGDTVTLTEREFALFITLARRFGALCTTDVLMSGVWDSAQTRRRLEVLVSRLRSSLRTVGYTIVAVPKRGYRLDKAMWTVESSKAACSV